MVVVLGPAHEAAVECVPQAGGAVTALPIHVLAAGAEIALEASSAASIRDRDGAGRGVADRNTGLQGQAERMAKG